LQAYFKHAEDTEKSAKITKNTQNLNFDLVKTAKKWRY